MPLLRPMLPIALAWAAGVAAAAQAPTLALRLDAGHPGALGIVNTGPLPVRIERAIAVEWQDADGWHPVHTEFNAVALCVRPAVDGPVTIAPGAALTVQPWRGYSCSGQCNNSCRANIYEGPGPFRFTVTMLPGREMVHSAPFTMPARPPGVSGSGSPSRGFSLRPVRPTS